MTLATRLTLLRIVLVPLLVICVSHPNYFSVLFNLTFFIALAFTDYLDGWIARKTNTVSPLGMLLDPLADKILVFTLLLFFMNQGKIAFLAVALLLGREFAVLGLRSAAALKQSVMKADWGGKIKTISQFLCIGWLIAELPFVDVLVWLTVALSLLSGLNYFWAYREVLRHG
ncbi:MAG: CDP-diacylglycerol--glycerol-3-phosphate 3-phosphatidyltransferase [Candidatus Margulisiibacteriota bacterium]